MNPVNETQLAIRAVVNELGDLLIAKNAAYGNSALDPVRVFSKADTLEQINVRMDDKLSRIARGTASGEDVEWDLMGYLVLKRVGMRMRDGENFNPSTLPPFLNQEELFAAMGLLMQQIEACGGSPELTTVVVTAGDIKQAIGNQWNPANEYAAKRVHCALDAARASAQKSPAAG